MLERLEQTAERARAESWPYECFLEALLEAEVFARDARERIRHAAFPARKTLEDFDWAAQPAAERPLVTQLAWIDEQANVCFLGSSMLRESCVHRKRDAGDVARLVGG